MEDINTIDVQDYGNYEKYDDIKVKIIYDPVPLNPREEFDNIGTFAMYHRKYDYGDKKIFSEPSELLEFLKKENCEYLNVYMIDHGSIGFSTSSYNDQWDSGQVGVIYVTPDDIKKNWGKDTPEIREKVKEILNDEIKMLDAYVSGQVFAYKIETPKGIYDSCYGFYDKKDCLDEALSAYKSFCENLTSSETIKNFIEENYTNYEHLPMECRTLEASKQYIDAGGKIENIPNEYIKSVVLVDETICPSM